MLTMAVWVLSFDWLGLADWLLPEEVSQKDEGERAPFSSWQFLLRTTRRLELDCGILFRGGLQIGPVLYQATSNQFTVCRR